MDDIQVKSIIKGAIKMANEISKECGLGTPYSDSSESVEIRGLRITLLANEIIRLWHRDK